MTDDTQKKHFLTRENFFQLWEKAMQHWGVLPETGLFSSTSSCTCPMVLQLRQGHVEDGPSNGGGRAMFTRNGNLTIPALGA